MHLFTVIDVLGDEKLLSAFGQTGFNVIQPSDFAIEDRFFCLVAKSAFDGNYIKDNWRPRLIFAQEVAGVNSHLYAWQVINCAQDKFFVGTLYERKFLIPEDWYLAYGTKSDDWQTFYKVVADYSYRYLLDEAMEETADWCGHMSSVVHQL